MQHNLECINVVGTGVDDDIATDIHLTKPTESYYIYSSHVSRTKLINSTQQSKLTSVIEASKPLEFTAKLYMYPPQQTAININRF